MGARQSRSFERGVSRTLLLVLVALVAALVGAVPGGPAEAASKKKPPGDPPGNNGTVKIERTDPREPQDLGNEPHGEECEIWLEFYGFDAGQTADIKFELQAPTKPKDGSDGVLLRDPANPQDPGVPISKDAAGGGPNDPEATEGIIYSFKLGTALNGVQPHEKQGYHIKVSVDVREAPGDSKKKVFWMGACPQAETPPASAAASTLRISKEQVGKGGGPFTFDLNCDHSPLNRTFTLKAGEKLDIADVPVGTTCAVTEEDKKGAESTTITEDPAFGAADDGTVKTVADKATIVTFKNKFPGDEVIAPPPNNDLRGGPAGGGGSPGASVEGANTAANPGASVLGATEERAPEAAATLPRTGADPQPLTAAGLWTLAAGGLALLAGRRPRRA